MATNFARLVRFEDPEGKIHYGEAGKDWKLELLGRTVPTYSISDIGETEFKLTGQEAEIAKVEIPDIRPFQSC